MELINKQSLLKEAFSKAAQTLKASLPIMIGILLLVNLINLFVSNWIITINIKIYRNLCISYRIAGRIKYSALNFGINPGRCGSFTSNYKNNKIMQQNKNFFI